ncbi:BZ3500_MvSof-1268-A1-R1_Chr4-2g07170 [Microbotryum saponariae]|uniref:BZ3500_MvSof-1268-A1-R1_Chr4-2g07170 protein n=1 Tax=Microbotryum saponariae TaxID=289078 RepID=A0A2X0KTY5_9BASI|nr:BZ3500_MvSof-1268-A1-R1_Chr4-2g07170 [Microbotryum saponariae]SDA06835.1 BZ3501_MvSof-1269-A2-R1_Chr4-2g06881 [Microbotryum saponariae]
MSLPPTRLFTPSCPKTSPPSNRPTLPDSPDQRRVSRHRCSDQCTQEWISTFGRRVDKQYGALARRYRHFGSLDGVVTTATPLEIGSLICFGLGRGMQLRSNCLWRRNAVHRNCAIHLQQSDNKPLQPRHAPVVGSTFKCRRTGASPHQESMLFHSPH